MKTGNASERGYASHDHITLTATSSSSSLFTPPHFHFSTMSDPIDPVELGAKLVTLRNAKKPREACDLLITDETVMVCPTMFSSETLKGKEAILKRWKKEDLDNHKIAKETVFKLVKPLVVTREITAEVMFMHFRFKQTLTFRADGKIAKSVVEKI